MSNYHDAWYCDDHERSVEPSQCPTCLAATLSTLTLRAEKAESAVARVRAVCEQQVLDRSAWIDGWNDALEMVEDALDEPEVAS